eukprot:scaffold18208_cov182-Amphora_coffeaeformis.AAC.8
MHVASAASQRTVSTRVLPRRHRVRFRNFDEDEETLSLVQVSNDAAIGANQTTLCLKSRPVIY